MPLAGLSEPYTLETRGTSPIRPIQTGIKTSILTIREIKIIFFTNSAPSWVDVKGSFPLPSQKSKKPSANAGVSIISALARGGIDQGLEDV